MTGACLDTSLDPAIVSSVDEVFACERSHAGQVEAQHLGLCRSGCGTTLLLCTPHLAGMRDQIARHAARGLLFGCAVCRGASASLDDVFEIIPLR